MLVGELIDSAEFVRPVFSGAYFTRPCTEAGCRAASHGDVFAAMPRLGNLPYGRQLDSSAVGCVLLPGTSVGWSARTRNGMYRNGREYRED
jgi:hypothetical protein